MHRVLIAMITLLPVTALAQGAQERAASDSLFDDGKRLVAAGDFERACPKFEASLKLLVRVGAKLNLADCYEKAGRTASAWAAFREAATLAERSNDAARTKFAHQRAAALEPYLARLAIKLAPESSVPGLTILRDGVVIPDGVYDSAVPVDPGDHTIEASAPRFQPWSQKVTVVREKTHTVEVPRLAPAPEPPPEARLEPRPAVATPIEVSRAPDAPPAPSGRKIAAFVVGSSGVAALGVTGVLAVLAKSRWNDAGDHCDAQHHCDATGLALNGQARRLGNIATATFGVGVAAVAAGVYLYVTAPRPERRERTVMVIPVADASSAGVAILGAL